MNSLRITARVVLTIVVVAAAASIAWLLWDYYMEAPWTRDARVRADIVEIAPDVSGIVDDVAVKDNQTVADGDLLFVIDKQRFALAVQEDQAVLEHRQAALAQAQRDLARVSKLSSTAISIASVEQYRLSVQTAEADLHEAQAALDTARLNLARTDIRAPTGGYITNLQLRRGDYVQAGVSVVALVDSSSFYVAGYFEETKLPRIRIGAPVTIRLMGVAAPLEGHVSGIATGIVDRERSSSPNLLANVNPTFSWVRLAQRIPVRIEIDRVPSAVKLVAGQTATVTVRP
jgi:RND family efflux transporter MFP subunit